MKLYLISLLLIPFFLCAQHKEKTYSLLEKNLYFPSIKQDFSYHHGLGFSMFNPPKEWVEGIYMFPMVDYKGVYSLKHGFQLNFDAQVIFVANRLALGPTWNFKIANGFYAGLGYQLEYNFGALRHVEFDNEISLFLNDFEGHFGFKVADLLFTVRGEIQTTYRYNIKSSTTNSVSVPPFFNGYSFSLDLEQQVWKYKTLTLGFNMRNVKYHVIAWPGFYNTKYLHWMPEFECIFNF